MSPSPAKRAKRKLVRHEAVVFVVDVAPSMNRPFPAAVTTDDQSPPKSNAATQRTSTTAKGSAADDDNHSGQATVSSPSPPDSSWRTTSTTTTTTYLDAAKRAVIGKLAELAASQRNETNVIVCGFSATPSASATTMSSIATNDVDEPDRTSMNQRTSRFSHPSITDGVTILQPETDLNPVTVLLLHRVKGIKALRLSYDDHDADDASRDDDRPPPATPHGDSGSFLNALVQAGEVLQSAHTDRTYEQATLCVVSNFHCTLEWPKQEMRRIEQLVDVLQTMKCRVNVVWLGDKSEGDGGGASAGDGGSDEVEDETSQPTMHTGAGDNPKEHEGSSEEDGGGDSDDNDDSDCKTRDDMYQWINKTDKVQFLRGIVEATGGDLVFASSVRQVLAAVRSLKMIQKATKKKLKLEIVSDLVVNVHQSALFVKRSLPTVKKDKVFLVDEEGKPMLEEGTREPLTDLFYKETMLTDGEDVVEPDDVAKAVSYGNDHVTMSDWDYIALKADDCYESRVQILGFLEESLIPRAYLKGPPKVISGTESEAYVPALAQALLELEEIGICTVSSQSSASGRHPPPILGALYPYRGDAQSRLPHRLVFLQLPFAGEVKQLQFSMDYDAVVKQHDRVGSHARSSDDLVDSMMLPSDVLSSVTTPNPAIRSWDQAVVQRFLDPTMNATALRSHFPMEPPHGTLEQAKPTLDDFWSTFNLPPVNAKRKDEQDGKGKRKKGKVALFYKDFL